MKRLRIFVVLLSFALLGLTVGGAVLGAGSASGGYRQLSNLQETLSLVRQAYVEPKNMDEVMDGAFRGLVEALDGESAFLTTQQEIEAVSNPSDAEAGWVGLDVSKRHGYAMVVSVAPDSPASEQGILRGDIVRAIDGHSTRWLSIIAVRQLLLSPVGSKIHLKLVSGEDLESRDLTLTSVARPPARLESRWLEDDIAYLRPGMLPEGMAERVQQAIRRLEKQQTPRALVLDLRSLSEGRLSEGVLVANLFVSEGVLARVRGRADQAATKRALTGLRVERVPVKPDDEQGEAAEPGFELQVLAQPRQDVFAGSVAVLIDGGTAGPAEVLAAALTDARGAEAVGTRSFGRASIQDLMPTGGGTALWLTVGRFVRADGEPLTDQGLAPTVEVEDSGEADEKSPEDSVLLKALEILAEDGRAEEAA